ncbi:hypothetical protein ACOME3_005833 [Neoechinorhynchus agilis]
MLFIIPSLVLLLSNFVYGDYEYAIRKMLECHNKFRTLHRVQNLTLDNGLSKDAQVHADWMSRSGRFDHAKNLERLEQGENLYMRFRIANSPLNAQRDLDQDPDRACKEWYCEILDYRFDRLDVMNMGTFHFTQLVWAQSTRVGFAIAVHKQTMPGSFYKYKTYIVARYSPPGNVIGTFHRHVKKTSFDYRSFCKLLKKSSNVQRQNFAG